MHEILDNYCVYSLLNDVGGVPWHRIGRGMEIVSGDDVREHAGFNRTIAKLNISLSEPGMLGAEQASRLAKTIDGYRATVDLKHGRVLGVVKEGFTLVQPTELVSAAEYLVNEHGAAISCAATIRDGKREFISLAMPEGSNIEARAGDTIRRFFNIAQGHDGSLAVSVGSSAIRVVCANTLAAFIGEGNAVRIRHTQGIHAALARAVAVFGHGASTAAEFYQRLANRVVRPEEVIKYYETLTDVEYREWFSNKRSLSYKIAGLLADPQRAKGIHLSAESSMPTTAWDAYNIATQVITHESTTKDPLNSLLWGAAHKHLLNAEQLASSMFLEDISGPV